MGVKYLLPCSCGRETVVEPRQAGETVLCACGLPLQIPTLLEMTSLETAGQEAVGEPAPAAWQTRDRVVLLGTLLTAAAVVAGIWLDFKRPHSNFEIDPYEVWRSAQRMSPSMAWTEWQRMKKTGIDLRTDTKYSRDLLANHVGLGVAVVIGLVGVALIAGGKLVGRTPATRVTAAPAAESPP